MPKIWQFYGVIITMYFADHPPPHFHGRYGEHEAQFEIASDLTLQGSLPRRAAGMVAEWAKLHLADLEANWERAATEQPLVSIEPLP